LRHFTDISTRQASQENAASTTANAHTGCKTN
jgi:hypothetical protein